MDVSANVEDRMRAVQHHLLLRENVLEPTLSSAKWQPNGLLLAQTPNPLCPTALDDFYRDPARVRPLHPDLLRFLSDEARLTFCRLEFTSPLPASGLPGRTVVEDLGTADVSGYRDYLLVARRSIQPCA